MDYAQWAKENKKYLVQQIINKFSVKPQDKPYAVFAAGIPGAGKTELLDRLFVGASAVRIDLDEIVKLFPDYSPEKYYEYRGAANIILDEVAIYCRHHRLNFVMDGTFGHKNAIINLVNALKRHDVLLLYVYKNPKEAWLLTKDRELVTKRSIDEAGFLTSCIMVNKNVKQAINTLRNKIEVMVIQKAPDSHNFNIIRNKTKIDDLLNNIYTKEELKRSIL